MRIIRYLRNAIKLSVLKARGNFRGSIIQNIGNESTVIAGKGVIEIKDRLNARNYLYLSAVDGFISIGQNCFLNQNVHIVSMNSITIGDGTIIGPNVVIVDHDHDYNSNQMYNKFLTAPISIGKNVWIGANVVITKGTIIGDNSVIAAGAVIRGQFEHNSVIYQERTTKTKTF